MKLPSDSVPDSGREFINRQLTSPFGFALNSCDSFSCGVRNSCHSMTSISLKLKKSNFIVKEPISSCSMAAGQSQPRLIGLSASTCFNLFLDPLLIRGHTIPIDKLLVQFSCPWPKGICEYVSPHIHSVGSIFTTLMSSQRFSSSTCCFCKLCAW